MIRRILLALLLLVSAAIPARAASVPLQADWGDPIAAITGGTYGDWDFYLVGAPSPCAVKLGSTYFLYYVGSNDYDIPGDTVLNRSLGVATSSNGVTFTKYGSNPIITFSSLPSPEEGIWGCAALADGSTIRLYYGTLIDTGSAIDIAIRYAESTDGLTFTNDQQVYYATGFESGPMAIIKLDTTYHLYFHSDKDGSPKKLYRMSGSTPTSFGTPTQVTTFKVIFGQGVWQIDASTLVYIMISDQLTTPYIESRTIATSALDTLGSAQSSFVFDSNNSNGGLASLLDGSQWFLYQVQGGHTSPTSNVNGKAKIMVYRAHPATQNPKLLRVP